MIHVDQIVNDWFTSNTYVISEKSHNWIWLVDVGDFSKVMKILPSNIEVKGVFVTHSHFDHIYGMNDVLHFFPNSVIYISEACKEGLYSAKLNFSFYHESPFVFRGTNVHVLQDNDRVELFPGQFLEVMATPGHHWGCLTYKIEASLFTGDSYIPNVDTVTKLRGGDRDACEKSLKRIKDAIGSSTVICPGHGEMMKLE